MSEEKLVVRGLLRHYWKKGLTATAAATEICSVEGEGTVHPATARKWFQRFRSGDTSLVDKPRCGRPVTTNTDALRHAVEEQPGTSTRRLAEEVHASQTTIVRHLHQLGFHSRRPLMVPHELTPEQAQRRVTLCRELLQNPHDDRFWRRIVTNDEKWVFLRYPDTGNQWLRPGDEARAVVQRGRFEMKTMLCVWWNFEGPVHWELVPQGRAVNGNLFADQLQRVYEVLRQRYPALVNRKKVLLQFDNAPCHRSRVVRQKIQDMDGLEILPHPAYSPDLAPSDFHLFRSMAHFLRGRQFNSVEAVKHGITEFFASKPAAWYRDGIASLAERWGRTIDSNGLYFAE